MKTAAALGIDDPLLRVLVWLLACTSLSLVGLVVGLIAMTVMIAGGVGFLMAEGRSR
jgi:phage shock protein PspC (stress-responsive transcriptional regulator)